MSVAAHETNKQVCILGSGTMGGQMALALAAASTKVALWGRRHEGLEGAQARIVSDLRFLVEMGVLSEAESRARSSRIVTATDLAQALDGADVVLEAIVEQVELKQELLCRVEQHVGADAVLASTTSAISPSTLQQPLKYPDRFVVTHFIQPAHLMELVEVVPGRQTREAVTHSVVAWLHQAGKRPLLCPDIPGFLFARIQHVLLREFVSLVEQGHVTPELCDAIMKDGYAARLPAMGCFEHADLAGLDLIDSGPAREVWADLNCCDSPAKTLVGALKAAGQLGMRTGSGFYDWKARDAEKFKRNRDEQIVRSNLSKRSPEP
ncbi:MAG: 3-hydroxyacyl-CoA dehydrogenase family protein [Planctomycetota bacterium]